MGGTCSMCGAERGANRVLVCQCKGKRPLGRPRRIWNNNIKIDPYEIGREICGLNCCGSGWWQVGGCCVCGDESLGSVKCGQCLN